MIQGMLAKYLDALFYSLMVGAGEAYFSAFALRSGHSELQAGLLATVPIVIGGILQTLTPLGLNKFQSFKTWTLVGSFLQAFVFLIMVFTGSFLADHYLALFLLVVVYWGLALGITPSWNSWISGLLNTHQIRSFFSNRNIIMAFGSISGLLFSGLLLHYSHNDVLGYSPFQVIFFICFILRICSFLSLSSLQNVSFKKVPWTFNGMRISGLQKNEQFIFRFILFSSLIKIGVFFSASFVTPYMLKGLSFSYIQYMLVLSASSFGRAVLGRYFRKHLSQFDINKVFFYAAMGVTLVPILWALSESFYYLLILEVLTGVFWGGFEVAFMVTLFEEIPSNDQGKYMTWYNIIHTLCIGLGSALGIMTFYLLGPSIKSYHLVFYTAGILRILSLLFFPRKKIINGQIVVANFAKTLALRPMMGMIERPMWPVIKKFKKKEE